MHSFTQWFFCELIPAFGRTLVHSLWQGAVAAVLAGIVIGITHTAPAIKRYNGLVGVYVLFVLTIAGTFLHEMSSPAPSANKVIKSLGQPEAIAIAENGGAANAAIDGSMGTKVIAAVNNNAVPLVGLWALLFLVQLTRMAFGLRYVQAVKRGGTHAVSKEWIAWIKETSGRLGIRQAVTLLQSERVNVPVAVGFLKPVILMPLGLVAQLSAEQVEAVLLHELAHIRRHDYLVNLAQSVADAVFFFNPAVRWISACIRHERETCCDNTVVAYTGNKKGYLEALVSFSRLSSSASFAMALGSNKTHLLNRVKTIVTRENSRLTGREKAGLVLGAAATMVFGAFAFTPKEKGDADNPVNEQKLLAVRNKVNRAAGQTAPVKKAVTLQLPKQSTDTIPQSKAQGAGPVKWKNLSTNINDDGQGKTTQVTATAEDGTVYRLRKIGEDVVLLSVNGREIAKEEYPQYYTVIDAIGQSLKQRKADALREQEDRNKALQQEQELLAQKRARMDEQRKKELLQRLETLQQEQSLRNEKEARAFLDKQKSLALLNEDRLKTAQKGQKAEALRQELYEQKRKEYNHTIQDYQSLLENYKLKADEDYNRQKVTVTTSSSIAAIIADLKTAGLVETENKLSFSLTNDELVVNGKAVEKGLFEKLKTKYIRKNGDRYEYFKDGGTTRTTVNLE